MLIKIPNHELEEVVIGGTLSAFFYSYVRDIPLIVNKLTPPHPFEKTSLGNSLELWNRLFFILSLGGINLLGDKSRTVRIRDKEVVVSTNGARVFKSAFKKLVIFDDENVNGLPSLMKKNDNFIVLDWIFSRSCELHDYTFLKTNDKLVREVYFYPSKRVDGNHPRIKDAVTISFLKGQDLQNFEYSDTYAKFKLMSMLKEMGLRGRKCGGNHYALDLEVEKREIRPAKMNLYKDVPHIKFKYDFPKINTNKNSYTKKINNLFQNII